MDGYENTHKFGFKCNPSYSTNKTVSGVFCGISVFKYIKVLKNLFIYYWL